jgi:hypothetical protein
MGCDQGGLFEDRKEEGGANIMGQLTCKELRKICIHASKAATPSEAFFVLFLDPHDSIILLHNTVLILHINLLCRLINNLNKP